MSGPPARSRPQGRRKKTAAVAAAKVAKVAVAALEGEPKKKRRPAPDEQERKQTLLMQKQDCGDAQAVLADKLEWLKKRMAEAKARDDAVCLAAVAAIQVGSPSEEEEESEEESPSAEEKDPIMDSINAGFRLLAREDKPGAGSSCGRRRSCCGRSCGRFCGRRRANCKCGNSMFAAGGSCNLGRTRRYFCSIKSV